MARFLHVNRRITLVTQEVRNDDGTTSIIQTVTAVGFVSDPAASNQLDKNGGPVDFVTAYEDVKTKSLETILADCDVELKKAGKVT